MAATLLELNKVQKDYRMRSYGRVIRTHKALDNLSFEGYFPSVTEIFNISDRIGAMILLAHFNNFMGDEYRP